MEKSKIERNVIILAIVIVMAVGVSGFFVYRNLTQIVSSIHEEVSSDYRLILIKDISVDLMEVENNIQLYSITRKQSNLKHFAELSKRLNSRVETLTGLTNENNSKAVLLSDSVKYLVETKLDIWDKIRRINVVIDDPAQQFEELYSMLEKKEIDTVKVEVQIEEPPQKKKGLLKRIFGKKDTIVTRTRIDTTYVEKTVESEEIKQEIEQLETDLREREQQKNRREIQLIQQNITITGQLNNLIARLEKEERDNLIAKNEETDQLATLIYKQLSTFSIAAVALLFVVLFLFVIYLQKARRYRKILTKAKSEAERLSKAKEVFMANVSHEMRTPVNAIYGLAEQLIQNNKSYGAQKNLSVLLKSANHLKEVVNDTLDFSKIQANKLKLEKMDFDPNTIITEVIDLHKPDAEEKNISLIYRTENDLPLALLGDPFRLKQVLINLIGNAIKFTGKGRVELSVETKSNEYNHTLCFKIKDTGIGISKENLEHIFEDFVQVETDYTRKFSGTGLGLSIVKKLVELQKGNVSIESELGRGTEVSCNIPYKIGNVNNIEDTTQTQVVIPEKVRNLKILGVDDEEFNRYLLTVIFDKWGLIFEAAEDGTEAVKLAYENNYDLILMDLRMPNLNGIEASKRILAEKPYSRIAAVAANNGENEIEKCREAGIRHFLSKPFSESELLDIIIKVIEEEVNDTAQENAASEFDIEELRRLSNGDETFMKEMMRIFIRSTQNGIITIKEALEANDWQGISDAAHKMAAPCKHIMANDLYAKIKELEKHAGNREAIETIPVTVEYIKRKIEKINKSLSEIVESDSI